MNPYKIGPYNESDAQIFKGRASEIRSMYQSFLQNDYLVCYANSGEGKSSILNAGLFPELRRQKYLPISIRFRFDENDATEDFDAIVNKAIDDSLAQQTERSISSIKESILYNIDEDCDKEWQTQLIKKSVWLRLRYSKFNREDGTEVVPVLVFDQFEEVFTNPKSELWTKEFFRWLEELSTDVCPDKILEAIKKKVGDELPLISSSKKFKAIFSLRSEYVGQVDYWGLQHFYIPDLKNNRFFLKPLTPESAREVILQQDGLSYISKEECDSIILGCCGNNEYVYANLPCVPSSVLSIVCRELFDLDDAKRKDILNALNKDKNSTINEILERYYERILSECGIKSYKQRDAFENALVDDKGNRKRIGVNHIDFKTFSSDQINKLINKNLLRVVSQSNNSDGYIVELPHDRFCKFILNHKNKRFEEIQSKNKRLKESLIFVLLFGLFCLTGLFLHNALYDVINPWLTEIGSSINSAKELSKVCPSCSWDDINSSKTILEKCIKLITYELSQFISYNSSISELTLKTFITVFCLLLYLILLPFSVLSFARRSKKSATVFSAIGILLSGWLLIRSSRDFALYAKTLTFFSFIVSSFIFIYSIANRKKMAKVKLSAWPLWGSYYLFCCYLFYEFLRCLAIGINEPKDSCFFILVLPSILLIFTMLYHNANIFQKKNKSIAIVEFILLLTLLAALSYNSYIEYTHQMKFDVSTVLILLLSSSILIALLLRGIKPFYRRTFAILINIGAYLIVFVLNLGYNPLFIHYSKKNITHVYNWRTVEIKDPTSNLFGLLNPINGDTIIPWVSTNKIDNSINHGYFSIEPKFINNSINTNSSAFPNTIIRENMTDIVSLVTAPTLEEAITQLTKKNKAFEGEELADHYSAKVFKALRTKSIEYFINGQPYSISDITSLNELDSLQHIAIEKELGKISITAENRTYQGVIRDNIDLIEDIDLRSLYSTIAKCMYMFVLKDRIQTSDFISVAFLTNSFPLLFFPKISKVSFTTTCNVNLNNDVYPPIIIRSEDLNAKKIFAFKDMFNFACYIDWDSREENYVNTVSRISNSEYLNGLNMWNDIQKDILTILERPIKNRTVYAQLKAFKENNEQLDIDNIIKLYKDLSTSNDSDLDNLMEQLAQVVIGFEQISKEVSQIREEQDTSFRDFTKKIFETMLPILEDKSDNIYYKSFENICKKLLLTCIFRGLDISEYAVTLMKIDSTNNKFYNFMTGFQHKVDSIMVLTNSSIEHTKEFINMYEINKTKVNLANR